MKKVMIIVASLFLVCAVAVSGALAEKGHGGKGRQQRAANANNAAVIQQNRLDDAAAAGQLGQGRMMRNGMMQQGAANVQQLAQLMLANFDQNGDGALNQVELESALLALMQQMQAAQQMAGGQAFAAASGQGNCQGATATTSQVRTQARNGQFAAGQEGGQRSAFGGNGRVAGAGGARRGR